MILSIDPGTIKIGISILSEKNNKVTYLTSSQVPLKGKSLEERLYYFFEFLDSYVCENINRIKEIALEDTFISDQKKNNKYKYNKNAPLKLSMARGIVFAIAGKYDLKIKQFLPGRIKKVVTGNYQASKKLMIKTINKLFNRSFEEDEADSIAIGITYIVDEMLMKSS